MTWVAWIVAGVALLCLVAAIRSTRELRAWLGRDPIEVRRWLRASCLILATALVGRALVLASTAPPELTGEGADVVLLFDVSRSMDARDTAPSRMRRAVRSAENLIQEARSVRLGLVIFAGEAFVALPLTQDRDAVLTYVRSLDSDTVSVRGSDLARGFELAARTFDPRSNRPRRVVLFSDGEHDGGSVEAAVTHMRSLGIELIAVGFGTKAGATVPLPGGGFLESDFGKTVRSGRDDDLLRNLAAGANGHYLREWEDRPRPEEILPPPDERQRSEAPRESDPLAVLCALAFALLAAELVFSSRARRPSWPRVRSHLPDRVPVAAVPLLALLLVAFGPASALDEGDALLDQGKAIEALSAFRRAERADGESPATRIRVGNAQYRAGRMDQAAAAYLDALRSVQPGADEARFAASFNLGNTLLTRQRFREAYDAYWTAMLARPDDLEAKFNYEWAASHAEPEPPLPDIPRNPQPDRDRKSGEGEGEESSSDGGGDGRSPDRDQERGFTRAEAERWMKSIEETVSETLERQITREYDGQSRARRGGQTW